MKTGLLGGSFNPAHRGHRAITLAAIRALELDEADFVRRTKGSFKLGIEFRDWGRIGDSYIHGFGKIGQDLGVVPFYHYWLKMHALGKAAPLDEYSINTMAARHGKFMRAVTDRPNSPLADIAYAYHFDAGLYARYLREYAEARGVQRIEGKVVDVSLDGESGDVASVTMDGGRQVAGQVAGQPGLAGQQRQLDALPAKFAVDVAQALQRRQRRLAGRGQGFGRQPQGAAIGDPLGVGGAGGQARGEVRGGFLGQEMVHPAFKAVAEGTALPEVLIPRVHWAWTCERLNVQDHIDGIPGEDTRTAIRRFERHYQLPETGEPSAAVLKKLKAIGAL